MTDPTVGQFGRGGLSVDAQAMMRFESEKKSTTTAYLLWIFLGAFSAHKFYLRQTSSALFQMFLFWIGLLLLIVGIGAVMMLAAAIWWFVDLFMIPGRVAALNLEIVERISGRRF